MQPCATTLEAKNQYPNRSARRCHPPPVPEHVWRHGGASNMRPRIVSEPVESENRGRGIWMSVNCPSCHVKLDFGCCRIGYVGIK
ncbi:hypothetical protein HZ326_14879 [Fusarium oxysporum f. sp. albedinis]|nr:hypothetical protein HZ326_14879 [Fusarium oxysporum f. sp. albedinis]